MNFKTLFVILFVLATGSLSFAQPVHNIWDPPYKQGIAAQVEDRIITFEEIRREMAPLVARLQQESRTQSEFNQRIRDLYREVMSNLIDRVLIVKHFYEKEFNIPQSVVEDEFDRVIIQDFGGDRARFHEHLRLQGKTVREFRADLLERIIVSVMRSEKRKSESYVSPERIESFYNENKIHFYQEEAVHLRLIMLRRIADESPDLMSQNASKVMAELRSGRDFEEVAKEFSQDNRREEGGDWGWIERGDLKAELSEVAFSLDSGEFSEPVELEGQIFILYAEDYREEGLQPISEVRERIEGILAGQLARQAQKAWLERLRSEAYIRYY